MLIGAPNILPGLILSNLPTVPSLVPIYKTTLTTTTDETTTTWTNVDIGLPHPNRMVILAAYQGVALGTPTATVNGYAQNEVTAPVSSHEFKVLSHRVPVGLTATITYTAASSLRKAVSVFVIYPCQPLPLDKSGVTANTTTNATIGSFKVQAGGCIIYVGGQHATLGTFTTTWNSLGASESVDAQIEGVASYTAGFVSITQSIVSTLEMAESTSGAKRLHAMSFSPPYSGLYPAVV